MQPQCFITSVLKHFETLKHGLNIISISWGQHHITKVLKMLFNQVLSILRNRPHVRIPSTLDNTHTDHWLAPTPSHVFHSSPQENATKNQLLKGHSCELNSANSVQNMNLTIGEVCMPVTWILFLAGNAGTRNFNPLLSSQAYHFLKA